MSRQDVAFGPNNKNIDRTKNMNKTGRFNRRDSVGQTETETE